MVDYYLHITYKSNERPFSTIYEPIPWHRNKTKEEVIKWAIDMMEGMGDTYVVTLVYDGEVIPLDKDVK